MRTKTVLIALTVWTLLQLPRFIALPLIGNVLAGHDPAAWLFPAIIDIVVALAVPAVIVGIWRHPDLWTWLFTLSWLVVSIFDHASAVTAFSIAGVPSVFAESGRYGPLIFPLSQAVIDAVFFAVLCRSGPRGHFFVLQPVNPAPPGDQRDKSPVHH